MPRHVQPNPYCWLFIFANTLHISFSHSILYWFILLNFVHTKMLTCVITWMLYHSYVATHACTYRLLIYVWTGSFARMYGWMWGNALWFIFVNTRFILVYFLCMRTSLVSDMLIPNLIQLTAAFSNLQLLHFTTIVRELEIYLISHVRALWNMCVYCGNCELVEIL